MKKLTFVLVVISEMFMFSCNNISIEDESYEDRPHFKIETKTATYFFDKAGGGLSRAIDSDGIDWINYKGDSHAVVPSGASSCYRGIPNMRMVEQGILDLISASANKQMKIPFAHKVKVENGNGPGLFLTIMPG